MKLFHLVMCEKRVCREAAELERVGGDLPKCVDVAWHTFADGETRRVRRGHVMTERDSRVDANVDQLESRTFSRPDRRQVVDRKTQNQVGIARGTCLVENGPELVGEVVDRSRRDGAHDG